MLLVVLKKGEFRPEYVKMLERVEYGDIDIILFSEFSRLARNATELLEQIKLFIDKGINLYFDKQKLWVRDSNKDVGSIILLHVLAVMSSYEIELFVERSLSGKITKVQAGHGGGDERAYGYMHNENKQIVINLSKVRLLLVFLKCMLVDILQFKYQRY